MKKYFRDFYGCTASILSGKQWDSIALHVRDPYGKLIYTKHYTTERGARIALGKLSDGWREIKS